MINLIILTFVLGYIAIAFEHSIKINKAATALVTGVLCWTIYILFTDDKAFVSGQLTHHLGDLSQILFFLMGAMTIVELIDSHDGFEFVTERIKTTDIRKLLLIVGLLTFFLSAILDNLTTTIVMISLIRKLMTKREHLLLFCGFIVISANAGGAWSPIGDVTTTMLWIGGQITALNIIIKLIIPSLVCFLVPYFFLRRRLKGNAERSTLVIEIGGATASTAFERKIVFITGIACLMMVPVFKTLTHLPPFMGMLIGLGIMWIITELIHSDKDEEDRKNFTVGYVMRKIDTPSILFFLGILLSISALQSTHILKEVAEWMDSTIENQNAIVISIGLLSSIVDNVPLVAASMGMYDLSLFPTDHYFWEFLAYCTGTGGSVLIIGSAAGVAAMGLEKIDFIWYLKNISWLALIGYFSGAAVYILQHAVFGI